MKRSIVSLSLLLVLTVVVLVACKPSNNEGDKMTGTFYSLQEAYDNELLTVQDLMSIAYYHGSLGGVGGEFIPTLKTPETLDTKVSNGIRQDFYDIYVKPHINEYDVVTIDDVAISVYYGTYSGAVAIRMKDNFGSGGAIREIVVADVTFLYNSGNDIVIWKDNI